MDNLIKEYRVKAMMHRFFSLYESNNDDFNLVRELLFEDGFVWNSPSGNLVSIEAFEQSFNELDKQWRHSHDPGQMTVKIIDYKKSQLSFDYVYQNLQGETMALHAKGHYEIVCIDEGGELPKIQKCDLTLIEIIKDGKFNDLYEKNHRTYLDYFEKSRT